ncbi:MAG: TIGR00296 family protein [Candidatus Micrarchaeaceae archaeon]
MHIYTLDQGRQLVKAARNSIELSIINPHFSKGTIKASLSEFDSIHGVFVTLEHYPTRELRGCIGFPRAIEPISESLIDAAVAAAFEDPRFVSVSKSELDDLLVDVSILSSPVQVTGGEKKRMDSIKVGRDGLMVQYGLSGGLLLPIVAMEQKWGKRRFLEETCRKAGLHHNYWSQPNIKLYKFETQVFREESPGGDVIEVKFDKG